MSRKRVVVTGVGPGTGTKVVERFLKGGYEVAMIARNAERLAAIERSHPGTKSYPVDITDCSALNQTINCILHEFGDPDIFIHNAVGGAFGNFLEVDPLVLKKNFDTNVMAFLQLARAFAPRMIEVGKGVIIASGNTSALRGKPNFAAFAPTKAAQRILAESMAREIGPKGVHVAYVLIDAVIDLEWTRKMNPDKPGDFFIQPAEIADEIYHVAHQPKGAWSFNVEIRPFKEVW